MPLAVAGEHVEPEVGLGVPPDLVDFAGRVPELLDERGLTITRLRRIG